MNEKIATRWLPVPATDSELRQRGATLASLLRDKELVQQEAKDSASSYKSRVSKLDVKINEVKGEINEKRIYRDVEVRLVPNIQDRVFEIKRVDDGAVVDLEDMTPSQFQELLNAPIPFGDDEDEPVGKEIAPTDDSDPSNGLGPRHPKTWIPLEDERPADDVEVETGLFDPISEDVVSKGYGKIYADWDQAWRTSPVGKEQPDEEWEVTHWRYIQPNADSPAEEGDAE